MRKATSRDELAEDSGYQSSNVAIDAVFDSVSVVTTFKEELAKAGVIFCSISEAVRTSGACAEVSGHGRAEVGQLFRHAQQRGVHRRLVRLHPEGVRCPMELSTYFRINEKDTGQFERTLIIADKGAYVLSGRLHRADAR